ncbi:MAG: rhodanese-related sulfurtransferase [Cyclobacteriaceae bacterium]
MPIITAEDLSLKENKEDVYFLDIRSEKEFAISHLPNAKLMAYDNFDAAQVSGIPKNAEIIVYCSVGYRSEKAGEKLMNAGYTNVRNIYGGIFEWKNQGNMVVGKKDQPTDSVHTYNKNWSQWLKNGIKVYE